MGNTGAPWNIPYVEPTDLVRDYPAADEAQALAVAAGLNEALGLVAVRQVVLATDTTNRSTTSGTYQDAGISVSITPKSATSSIYIIYSGYSQLNMFRGTGFTYRFGDLQIVNGSNNTLVGGAQVSAVDRDSALTFFATTPSTDTSARSYKLRFRIRNPGDPVPNISLLNATSTGLLIAMEVE